MTSMISTIDSVLAAIGYLEKKKGVAFSCFLFPVGYERRCVLGYIERYDSLIKAQQMISYSNKRHFVGVEKAMFFGKAYESRFSGMLGFNQTGSLGKCLGNKTGEKK